MVSMKVGSSFRTVEARRLKVKPLPPPSLRLLSPARTRSQYVALGLSNLRRVHSPLCFVPDHKDKFRQLKENSYGQHYHAGRFNPAPWLRHVSDARRGVSARR